MSDQDSKLLFAMPVPYPMWAIVTDQHGQPRGQWSSSVRKVAMLGCFEDNAAQLEPLAVASSVYRMSGDGDIEDLFDSPIQADLTCLHWAVDTCKHVRLSDGRCFDNNLAIQAALKKFSEK